MSDQDIATSVLRLAPEDLTPCRDQPRKHFDPDKLAELADSMSSLGQEMPITARRLEQAPASGPKFEIIAGERRWRAAQMIRAGGYHPGGHSPAPRPDFLLEVIVREIGERTRNFLRQLAENVVREDMPYLDEAAAYERLIEDEGMTIREITAETGIKRSRVHERYQLRRLPERWQSRLASGEIAYWVAREALYVEDADLESALETAETCRSKAHAHEVLQRRFVRPAKEREVWESPAYVEERDRVFREFCLRELDEMPIADDRGELFRVMDYEICRRLFPWDAGGNLYPMNAGSYVLADAIPDPTYDGLAPGVVTSKTWGDLAALYSCPFYVALDDEQEIRVLVDSKLIKASETVSVPNPADRVFAASSQGGKRQQQAAARHDQAESAADLRDRAEMVAGMLRSLDLAIRRPAEARGDRVWWEAVVFCLQAGALGFYGANNPSLLVLAALGIKEGGSGENVFRHWPGLFDAEGYQMDDQGAAVESLCVLSWVLYALDSWDGDDPRENPTWVDAAEFYGVELEG